MKTPTTLDIRAAVRKATDAVVGVQSYTDRYANQRSRVSYLMYGHSLQDVQKFAAKANEILVEQGFSPVVYGHQAETYWGPGYSKLSGVGARPVKG